MITFQIHSTYPSRVVFNFFEGEPDACVLLAGAGVGVAFCASDGACVSLAAVLSRYCSGSRTDSNLRTTYHHLKKEVTLITRFCLKPSLAAKGNGNAHMRTHAHPLTRTHAHARMHTHQPTVDCRQQNPFCLSH